MGLMSWQELEKPGHETEREHFGHLVALGTGGYVPFLKALDGYIASLRLVHPRDPAFKPRSQPITPSVAFPIPAFSAPRQAILATEVRACPAGEIFVLG